MFYFQNNSGACQKFENEILDREGDPDQDFSPIVLVDRQDCSFARKVRNVQDLGGALALIMDNRDNADPESLIMIDDGTGTSIAIPSMMISKEFGLRLKQAVLDVEQYNKQANVKKYVVILIDFIMVRLGC